MPKSILVTGSSSGFGKEIALYLAERGGRGYQGQRTTLQGSGSSDEGFQVYASMRNLAKRADLETAAAERGVTLRILQLDITQPDSIAEAVQTIVAECGGIYGLINNAGLFLRGYFEDLAEAEIRQLFETNLFGTMAMTRAVLPHMRQAGQGRIVFITSVAGRIGAPSGSVYSASRFAQEGFAESLSQEVEPLGLQAIMIEPGITKTEDWTPDRYVAARAKDPNSPYYTWFRQTQRLFHQTMEASPITTTEIAATIHEALTVKRPRLRYVVGRRAKLVLNLRRYIPGELFERVYFGEVMRRITKGEA